MDLSLAETASTQVSASFSQTPPNQDVIFEKIAGLIGRTLDRVMERESCFVSTRDFFLLRSRSDHFHNELTEFWRKPEWAEFDDVLDHPGLVLLKESHRTGQKIHRFVTQ